MANGAPLIFLVTPLATSGNKSSSPMATASGLPATNVGNALMLPSKLHLRHRSKPLLHPSATRQSEPNQYADSDSDLAGKARRFASSGRALVAAAEIFCDVSCFGGGACAVRSSTS